MFVIFRLMVNNLKPPPFITGEVADVSDSATFCIAIKP